jgi:hypothetical protein
MQINCQHQHLPATCVTITPVVRHPTGINRSTCKIIIDLNDDWLMLMISHAAAEPVIMLIIISNHQPKHT